MLSFDSEAEFYATLDSLETAFENYQLNFQRDYENMSDDDLNDLIESQNIDLEEPLSNFEAQYNFLSLRKELNNQEAAWLNQANPIEAECPQLFVIEDHVERTLWNHKGELMIAGKIYKYEDERYIVINDGDLNKLSLINSGNTAVFSNNQVLVQQIGNSSSSIDGWVCQMNKNKNGFAIDPLTNNFKLIYANRIKSRSWEFGEYALYASSYSYKKINGSWKNWVTTISVGFEGQKFYDCNNPNNVTAQKSRRSNSVVQGHKRSNSFGLKYNSNYSQSTMQSFHYISNPGLSSPTNGFNF